MEQFVSQDAAAIGRTSYLLPSSILSLTIRYSPDRVEAVPRIARLTSSRRVFIPPNSTHFPSLALTVARNS